MEILLNSVDPIDIKDMWATGLISGITTNPKLISESEIPFEELIKTITEAVDCPVSVQVISEDVDSILREAKYLSSISKKIVVKIPATFNGFTAAAHLRQSRIETNITLCYSLGQVLLGMTVNAKYISIFLGNMLEQVGESQSKELMRNSIQAIKDSTSNSKILAASIRSAEHFLKAIEFGADCITTQSSVIKEIAGNSFSEKGLSGFLEKWNKSDQRTHFQQSCPTV